MHYLFFKVLFFRCTCIHKLSQWTMLQILNNNRQGEQVEVYVISVTKLFNTCRLNPITKLPISKCLQIL
jgi:hypothetical protein